MILTALSTLVTLVPDGKTTEMHLVYLSPNPALVNYFISYYRNYTNCVAVFFESRLREYTMCLLSLFTNWLQCGNVVPPIHHLKELNTTIQCLELNPRP